MPEKNTECLVENSFLKVNNKQIGDKITLDVEKQTNDEGEEIDYLEEIYQKTEEQALQVQEKLTITSTYPKII